MKYSPIDLANSFVKHFKADKNNPEHDGISHMKLQKLVYLAYGWWLAYHEYPILKEGPQVWKYGPMFASMFYTLKVYGLAPIAEPVQVNPFATIAPCVPENDQETHKILQWVWKRYGHLSAHALSAMAREKGSAWRNFAKENNFFVPKFCTLPNTYIKDEFCRKMDSFGCNHK